MNLCSLGALPDVPAMGSSIPTHGPRNPDPFDAPTSRPPTRKGISPESYRHPSRGPDILGSEVPMSKFILAVLALGTLNGCYFGKKRDDRPWPTNVASHIEVGKTTKAEVLKLMGPPKVVVRLLESEAYMYVATVEKTS